MVRNCRNSAELLGAWFCLRGLVVCLGLLPTVVWSQGASLSGDPFSDAAPGPAASADAATITAGDVPPDTPATLDGGGSLNPLLTAPVRDNTIGIEYQERPAYFYGLWLASQLKATDLMNRAQQFRNARQRKDPRLANLPRSRFQPFVDVFEHPADYRGQAVAMTGYLRSLKRYDPGPNDLGIGEVYEGWFYTEDSQSNPGVVIFTQKPEGLPLGADITEEIRFSGYFLKMYGYEAQDYTRKAPLFLAGAVEWFPTRAANVRKPVSAWVYGGLTMIAILSVWGLWTMFQHQQHRRSRYESPERNFDEFPPQEFLGPTDGSGIEPHH